MGSLAESTFSWLTKDKEIKMLEEDRAALLNGAQFAEESELPFYQEAVEIIEQDLKNLKNRDEREEILYSHTWENQDEASNEHFYYQGLNRRMFLHPITKRLITEQFCGSEDPDDPNTQDKNNNNNKLPDQIIGKVVEIDTIHVSEDIIKRFKFLDHLPLGTPVQLVEFAIGGMKAVTFEKDEKIISVDSEENPQSIETVWKENTERITFDKNVLNKMRPAINKRKTARKNRLNDQKKYDQNFDNNNSTLEDLYSYCDQLDSFPLAYQQTYDYNEQIGHETGVTLPDSSKVESFGLAAKITTPKGPEKAFGLAARMRGNSLNEKFEKEMVAEILGHNNSSNTKTTSGSGNLTKFRNPQPPKPKIQLSPPKRAPRIDDLNNQPYEDDGLELDAGSSLTGQCFLQITTKNKSTAKEKRANKRKNKKKNVEKI